MTLKFFLQLWCVNILVGGAVAFIGYLLFDCAFSSSCNISRKDRSIFTYGATSALVVYPFFLYFLIKSDRLEAHGKNLARLLLYIFTGPVCAFLSALTGFLIYIILNDKAGPNIVGMSFTVALFTAPISILLAYLVIRLNIIYLEKKNILLGPVHENKA